MTSPRFHRVMLLMILILGVLCFAYGACSGLWAGLDSQAASLIHLASGFPRVFHKLNK